MKLMGGSKDRSMAQDWIGVDSILLDPAIPEILVFCFKHDAGAANRSNVIIFI